MLNIACLEKRVLALECAVSAGLGGRISAAGCARYLLTLVMMMRPGRLFTGSDHLKLLIDVCRSFFFFFGETDGGGHRAGRIALVVTLAFVQYATGFASRFCCLLSRPL